MIHRCAGCGLVAHKFARYNEDLFVCMECAALLPALQTRFMSERHKMRCLGCDETVYHGVEVCNWCIDVAITWVASYAGLETLDDNPFIHRLIKPHVQFLQRLNSDHVVADPNWYRFFLWNDGDRSVFHEISFRGLTEFFVDSA